MLSQGHACSIIIHISQLVEAYGDNNTLLQLEALNTLNYIIKSLINYHRDYLTGDEAHARGPKPLDLPKNKLPSMTEILLEDVVALYVQQLEFDKIYNQINDQRERLRRQESLGTL